MKKEILTSFLLLLAAAVQAQGELQGIGLHPVLPDNSRFGQAVALDDALALLSAPGESASEGTQQGAVYVYRKEGESWLPDARLIAPDASPFDYFGHSLALHGASALIGAPGDDDGAAYVFEREQGGWTSARKLLPVTEADAISQHMRFGEAVALSGDYAAVGAPNYAAEPGLAGGAVYLFRRTGADWELERRLDAPAPVAGGRFGKTLALSGDRLLVGAPGADGGATRSGVVYLYERSAGGWSLAHTFIDPDSRPFEFFGSSIDLDGPWVVIGIKMHGPNQQGPTGGVQLYVETPVGWQLTTTLTAHDGLRNDYFGEAVAIEGNTVAVSAVRAHHAGFADAGAVYLYENENGHWQQRRRLAVEDTTQHHQQLGTALAIHHGTLLIGAPLEDKQNRDCGNAYFHRFEYMVGTSSDLPFPYRLHPISPNPFQREAAIVFDLPRAGPVRVGVYDAQGRPLAILADGPLPAGPAQRLHWRPRDESPGVYYVRLVTEHYQSMEAVVFTGR